MTTIIDTPQLASLRRAFKRRLAEGYTEDKGAANLINDIVAEVARAKDAPSELPAEFLALVHWDLQLGVLASELFDLLPEQDSASNRKKFPTTFMSLFQFILSAWICSAASEVQEELFAGHIRHMCDSIGKDDLPDLRKKIRKALDGPWVIPGDCTRSIQKASRFLANPNGDLMGGDLYEIVFGWIGYRVPAATAELLAGVLKEMPAYDIHPNIPELMRPALSAYAKELARAAQLACDLRSYLLRECALNVPDIALEEGRGKVVIKCPAMSGARPAEVLNKYSDAVSAWKQLSTDEVTVEVLLRYEVSNDQDGPLYVDMDA